MSAPRDEPAAPAAAAALRDLKLDGAAAPPHQQDQQQAVQQHAQQAQQQAVGQQQQAQQQAQQQQAVGQQQQAQQQAQQQQQPPQPRARMRCFSEAAPDATLHFQLLDLGAQLFVWVGAGGARLQNMFLAIQLRPGALPSVATLLPDASPTGAASLAQRLARRVGRPVVCSCNLPANADMLQVIAERRLCRELDAMGLSEAGAAAG